MKKVLMLASTIMTAFLICCTLQSCNPARAEEDQGGTANFPIQQTQQQQTQQVPQQTTPQTAVMFYGPVSWNNEPEWADLPITREQVEKLAKGTPDHRKLAYCIEDAYVTRIDKALEIRGIQSGASSIQFVVWYTYTTDGANEATGLVLIQAPSGTPSEVRDIIRDLATTLNNQRCCKTPGCNPIYFGGCIIETSCAAKPVDPCVKKSKNCGPCQQGSVIHEGGDSSMSANQPNASRAVPQRRRE